MRDARIVTGIDVGTTKVCTIMGRTSGPRDLEVLAHSLVPCEGLKKGNVEDITATARAIRASVDEIERRAQIAVRSAYVGVTGAHVTFENRVDTLDWVGKHGVITAEELTHVPETVASVGVAVGREVIHALPITYRLDGRGGIRNPLGMHTDHLEVETHVVTGAPSPIEQLARAVESSGLKVEGLVLEPLASSEAVLTREEKDQGAVLVDIGGGTTDVVVFRNGRIAYTGVIPVGGYQFTYDICQTYNTTYAAAEAAKLAYAHTEPYVASAVEEVSLPVLGRVSAQKVPRRDICQLVRERAQELVPLIRLKLNEAQIDDVSRIRLVLTGGSSNLPGLQALMQRTLTNHVRIGVPNVHPGIPGELRAPHFATGVGILLWAKDKRGTATAPLGQSREDRRRPGRLAFVHRFLSYVRGLWPQAA